MNLSQRLAERRTVGLVIASGAVLISVLFTALVIAAVGADPLDVVQKTWEGIYGLGGEFDPARLAGVVNFWIPLMLASLGLLLTFTTGLWNIGIEGQMLFGAICASWVALNLSDLPGPLLIAAEFTAGALGGAAWAALTGLLKTWGGVHEIFGGVALNNLASILTIYLVSGPWSNEGGNATPPFAAHALLPALEGFPVSLAALALVGMALLAVYLILRGTRWGLELKATGKSPRSALLLGVPTGRHAVLAMAACGLLAGMAGTFRVAFTYGNLRPLVSGGIGFLALLVVLLTGTRTLWVPLVSFLFAAMLAGTTRVKIALGLDQSLAGVIQGFVVLLAILGNGLRGRLSRREPASPEETAPQPLPLHEGEGAAHG